ncbi:MAG: ice-binding family protein [Bacteroidota bacterium]
MKPKLHPIITIILVLLFTRFNFSQTINLGAVANFTFFTSIGAFNNVGASNITGDIGTHDGAFSGFLPGTLDGQIHNADATSLQASIDLDQVYDDLNALTCNTTLANTLGSGQILLADVYSINSAASLTGDLILDAENDPNAIFVIKIDGAFSTSALSKVILTNNANLCNVYWQINGALSLGSNSEFNGTLITNGAISLANDCSLFGRALTKKGAVSLDNNVGIACLNSGIVLPINLIFFEAEKSAINSTAILNWQTASENNSSFFQIEKSDNGVNFRSIGVINAAGSSSNLSSYNFIDEEFNQGMIYYRLNQFDYNGINFYSEIKVVDFSITDFDISLYPNPFNAEINITLKNININDSWELKLYNVLGDLVDKKSLIIEKSKIETSNFPSGIYFYKVFNKDKLIQSGKLISN